MFDGLRIISAPLAMNDDFPLGSLPPELGGMEALRTFQVPSNQLRGEGNKGERERGVFTYMSNRYAMLCYV